MSNFFIASSINAVMVPETLVTGAVIVLSLIVRFMLWLIHFERSILPIASVTLPNVKNKTVMTMAKKIKRYVPYAHPRKAPRKMENSKTKRTSPNNTHKAMFSYLTMLLASINRFTAKPPRIGKRFFIIHRVCVRFKKQACLMAPNQTINIKQSNFLC